MMAFAKRVFIHILGWSFILLGVVGLFLPVLQGILFLLIGLVILSGESIWAKNLIQRIRKRYPEQYDKVHAFNEKMKNRLRKTFGTSQKP